MSEIKFSWKAALRPLHIWIVVLVFLFDQVTKWMIIFNLRVGESISVLPFFEITHIKNKGAAFGVFHNTSPAFRIVFFGIVTLVCLYLLIYWLGTTLKEDLWQRISLSLILGGALGNLKDRSLFGQVTDFLYFHYEGWSWPAFNIADSAISVGVALILLRLLPIWKKKR